MRVSPIFLAAGVLSAGSVARPTSYVDHCSTALTGLWQQAVAKHPIEASKHIPVVLINVPQGEPANRYPDAIRNLTLAFPSFKESAGSGIVAGACCAWPVFGSISFDDLEKLSAANFIPLCDVGERSGSKVIQVRMEYRERYEKGFGAAPYFWISY